MRKIAVALIIVMMTGMTTFADPTADSETVKSIQTALNAAGYDCGEPDGIVGQKTMDALSKYCSEKGITWDGTITDELVVSLGGGEDETEDAATQYDDKLQQIFANLTFSTTEGDLLSWIEQYGLEYSAQKWNGTPKELTYKIAYEEGVTAQKYADSGDHIEVSFNADDGTFLLAEYCPSCAAFLRKKINITKEELILKLKKNQGNRLVTSKEIGVSETTIRKWCKNFNLPKSKKELKEFLNNL